MNKTYIWAAVAIVLIGGAAYFLAQSSLVQVQNTPKVSEDPLGVTNAFYQQWLTAKQSTTSNPYDMGLLQNDMLSDKVKTYLESKRATYGTEIDPVLCLTNVPGRVGVKSVYEASTTAQVLVVPRGQEVKTAESAVVDLELVDYAWKITNIACSNGETAPEREFTFMESGYLKKGLPAPYDTDTWYIVFSQPTGESSAVALLFGPTSLCTLRASSEAVCDPSTLQDTSRITVAGTLLESGAEIARLVVNE